jgi:hypothetical protein
MRPHVSNWISSFFIGLIVVGGGMGLRAAEGPSEKALAKHGLKRSGPVLVLEAEKEVKAKADEVRQLSRQLNLAVTHQRSTLSEKDYQNTIKELTAEVNQLRTQINNANNAMNRIPKRRGYPINNVYAEEYAELNYFKNQAQLEVNQRTAYLNQLRSKPFDPKARMQADTDVRNREESLHQGVLDLRKLVDGIHEKYEALGKDPQVKTWLDTPEGPASVKPKLGPSRAFLQDEKMLQRLEAHSAADEPSAATPTKAAKKSRRSKTKRSAGTGSSTDPF